MGPIDGVPLGGCENSLVSFLPSYVIPPGSLEVSAASMEPSVHMGKGDCFHFVIWVAHRPLSRRFSPKGS